MGKHAALAFLAALLRGAAMADFAAIEIAAGGEWRVDSACRLFSLLFAHKVSKNNHTIKRFAVKKCTIGHVCVFFVVGSHKKRSTLRWQTPPSEPLHII